MRQSNVAATLALLAMWAAPVQAVRQPDLSSGLANTLTDLGISAVEGSTACLVIFGNDREKQAGRRAADAVLVTGVATELLKQLTNQSRPDHPEVDDGFPSGHASVTFAFARCISDEYRDWGKLAYLWAAGVSWSRVRREDHSIAQVVAGALLGSYIADRSLSSKGGLLGGLIVKDKPPGFAGRPASPDSLPHLSLWQAQW